MGSRLNKLIRSAAGQTSHTDIYRVDNTNKRTSMNLEIGIPGQSGISKVKVGKNVLLDDHDGAITDLKLGSNAELDGKFLSVKTAVTDTIIGKPDDTFVRFTLTGGPDGEFKHSMSMTVMSDGDTIFYEIEIFFFG